MIFLGIVVGAILALAGVFTYFVKLAKDVEW